MLPIRYFFVPLFIFVTLLTGCEAGDASSSAPYHYRVVAQPMTLEQGYNIDRYFVGQVEARQRAELGFELAGTIADVLVDEGDIVEAGQPMVVLDSRLLQAEILEINAQREDISARLELAKIKIKRQHELSTQGFSSKQQIDELNAEIASMKAQLKRQRALLESAKTRLAKHTLKAPYRGEVAKRYTEAGAVAIAGQAVLQLLEQGGVEAKVGVPAKFAATINVGAKVQVMVAGRHLKASVLAVATNVDAVTRTSSLRLAMPDDGLLVDGEMLYLLMPEQISEQGFWVPDTALSAGVRGLWNVYALVEAQQGLYKVEARSIELMYMARGRAFVKGAVASDELVMSSGLHRVVPGLLVRLESEPG